MLTALPVRILLCLILVCVASCIDLRSEPVVARPAVRPPDVAPDQFLIGFYPGTPEVAREAIVARGGARLVRHLASADAALVELPRHRPSGVALAAFATEGAVRYVEPNYRYHAAAAPNDPHWTSGSLWGLERIDALEAWDVTTGSADVVVGVVDTGIDHTHSDLAANIWTAPDNPELLAALEPFGCEAGTHGYRSIGGVTGCGEGDTADDNGHGTLVAGIIGARGNNGAGVVGVNWQVSLMSLKALDELGVSTAADIVQVIDYAIAVKQAGVNLRVLNMSWGQLDGSVTIRAALEQAGVADILVVVAAGNAGLNLDLDPFYPASYGAAPDSLPNIVAVTGTDRNEVYRSDFNIGPNTVHLAAPGEGIFSTSRGDKYAPFDGTSMAAAHVAGAAALLLSAPGLADLSFAQLKTRLLFCADPLVATNRTITDRRLNVARALRNDDCDVPPYVVSTSAVPTEGGRVAMLPNTADYPAGTTVVLTATAASGYRFTGWRSSGEGLGSTNPLTLTIFHTRTIEALFERERYLLTLTGTSGGQVSATPPAGAYPMGTPVELSATPVDGFVFVNWTLNGSDTTVENPLSLTMDRNHTAHATFALAPSSGATYQLTLTASAGGAAVASAPGPYAAGTRVTLTAIPAPGFLFTGWTIDGVEGGRINPLVFTMNDNRAVRANFAPGHALHLSWTQGGNAAASATTWPDDSPYPAGTLVTLTATTNSDYIFTGWTIDGTFQGWANPLTLTMGSEHSVVANFARRRHFTDLPPGPPPYEAISQLAARLIILGYSKGDFGPNDTVQRAQMAALIARAMGWDREDHGNPFTDDNGIDPNLWRNVGTLAHYGVAKGYGDGTFGPFDPVLQVQVISFITRGMVAQGRWVAATTDDPTLYPNVPASTGHRLDLVTYHRNAGAVPGTDATQPWAGWTTPSTRGWFAEALWQAMDRYYSVDRVP